MDFNTHSRLEGQHAFLSASSYHWINYDEDKIDRVFAASIAARRGSELHALAHHLIRLNVKLEDSPKTLNQYVNDAIGFHMHPEQILYYSDNAFGTADAISFRNNILRISDLKTGVTPAHVHQLEVYAAFFCLEYRYKPFDIPMEFRIYQSDEIREYAGDPDAIMHIMDKIITFDKRITEMRLEEL
jgi:hypothetical protein